MRASDFKQIHALTTGEYSDYRVNAIFEDEEDAQAWADAMNARNECAGASVESFPVMPKGTPPTMVTRWWVNIFLYPDGRTEQLEPYHQDIWGYEDEDDKLAIVPRVARYESTSRDYVLIQGPSEEHVLKVASERMARWKAEGHILEAARKEIKEEKRT